MLTLWRRHRSKCSHKDDRYYRKCRCVVWCEGTVESEYRRHSLKTRSWERAEEIKRDLEDGTRPKPEATSQPKKITIKEALDAFIKDCESRNLNPSTLRKYRRLRDTLAEFASTRGLTEITALGTDAVRKFRQGRTIGARTAAKEIERLRAFFRFCVENDWISKNPAKPIRAPQVKVVPRLPFSEGEVQAIIAQAKDDRELAFVLTLRHTGLRIGDASLMKASQFDGGRIYLYTTKAGTPVSVVVPPHLASLLKALPTRGGYFFLRGDSTAMHTTADLWRRAIKRMCKDGKVNPDHPHRFRHTLAADLLSNGVSVENVAAILGNSPAIVIKHYSQWIRSRQEALDAAIESTWTPSLVRVK